MNILWIGHHTRVDFHDQHNYEQVRNRLWGVIYSGKQGYIMQCDTGSRWIFRSVHAYQKKKWIQVGSMIRYKINEHHFRSLIPDEEVSNSKFDFRIPPENRTLEWIDALKNYSSESYDQLRKSWMMHLLNE